MKTIVHYIFLLISSTLIGQNLPEFTSNASEQEKSKSLVYTTYREKYDAVISYEKACALKDPTKQSFYLLVKKNNKWKFLEWEVELKNAAGQEKKIKKSKTKELPINGVPVDSLLNYWTQQGFWTFRKDSLNSMEKIEDGNSVQKFMPDGCSDVFEVFTRKRYYVMSVTNADDYQEFVYNKQRGQFIRCREKFHRVSVNK